ncbi:MAG: hypothetical protein VW450_04025 [Chloroflexota bacterium]
MKMQFRACPRCGGDLHESSDLYGRYNQCVQCGHTVDLPVNQMRVAVKTAVRATRETKDAAA